MNLLSRFAIVFGIAVFLGSSVALWSKFGGGVYAALLTGAFLNCF